MEKTDFDERAFEYSYNDSIRDIKQWRDYVGDLEVPQAYFLHKADLLFLINELMNQNAKGMGIRCYPARDEATGENHLLMVAVVEEDGYPNGKDIYDAQVPAPSRIFDLSRPCPNMCDVESALYAAGVHKERLPLRNLVPGGEVN
jgi:hypothetical protein